MSDKEAARKAEIERAIERGEASRKAEEIREDRRRAQESIRPEKRR